MEVVAERMNALEVDSFAYNTLKDRIPNIIVKGLDYFCRTWKVYLEKKNGRLPEQDVLKAEEEAKEIIQSFSKLRYELTTNKPLTKLEDNWEDVNLWNSFLENYTKENNAPPTYFDSPMLYTECYIYRRICNAFQKSKYFKKFDIFLQIKRDGLISAERATTMIMEHTSKIGERIQNGKSTVKEEFVNYIEFGLWGNKCDLSLPIGDTVAETFNLLEDLKKQKSYILKNSTEEIYQFFLDRKANKPISRIDIVLDNAGFELVGDFCFIEMLYQTGLIDPKTTIVKFHPKNCGWFVSDVLNHDLYWTLNFLCSELKSPIARELGQLWAGNLREGRWSLKNHYFWTTPFEFPLMKQISVHLYEDLCKSDFILFKGDLNYRKLVSDMRWEYTTPFKVALRGFWPTLATMRTIKFNPLCDLDNEQAERFKKINDSEKHSGIYAVISFHRAE